MLLRLRIALPDRPGSLARVSRVLGALGADIRAMTVLDHGGNRVLDEFTVSWPGYPGAERLADALAALPGVSLEGAWATRAQSDAFPDLDVLLQLMAGGAEPLATLADALPAMFGADWAVVIGEYPEHPVLAASPQVPVGNVLPEICPTRPLAFSSGSDVHVAAVPAGPNSTVYLGRSGGGPAFHRIELARLTRLVEVAGAVLERRSGAVRTAQRSP